MSQKVRGQSASADRQIRSDQGLDVWDGGKVATGRQGGRPVLGVFFRCANKYIHVPRNADGTAYRAMCPTCGKRIDFVVGPGGTPQRFFEISC